MANHELSIHPGLGYKVKGFFENLMISFCPFICFLAGAAVTLGFANGGSSAGLFELFAGDTRAASDSESVLLCRASHAHELALKNT
jgi:hypothetical protein